MIKQWLYKHKLVGKLSYASFKCVICILILIQTGIVMTFAQTASEVITKSEEKMRGSTLQGILVLKTIRPSWSREMKVNIWMKGDDYAMIRVQSPEKDKGITFLKRSKELWNWIPAIDKTIKLPPSMMSQSWMGTDFSNDYLVKESSLIIDFDATFGSDSVIDGRECWKVILTPKELAAVVWGKVILFIDKSGYLQLLGEYFDEDGELINSVRGSNIQKMGGRFIPTVFEMIPNDKPGNKTVLTYTSVTFDLIIDDAFFTIQNMKQLQ